MRVLIYNNNGVSVAYMAPAGASDSEAVEIPDYLYERFCKAYGEMQDTRQTIRQYLRAKGIKL